MLLTRSYVLLLALGGVLGAQQQTEDQYISSLNASLDQVIATYQSAPRAAMPYSGNLFLAHGAIIQLFPIGVLNAYADGLRQGGAVRVDINPRLGPWLAPNDPGNAPMVAKYDALIAHIRQLGMQLVINPQYSPPDPVITSFDQWQTLAVQAWTELARRYQPDVFVVIHEPTTMANRMGISATPQQWAAFAQATAQAVKQQSPGSRIGAGGLWNEFNYFQQFVSVPQVETLTLDIYDLDHLSVYAQMAGMAQQAGKPTYIEETWRQPYVVPQPGATLEQLITQSIGNPDFQALDAKWMQALSLWAGANGMSAMTPFWTNTFFAYASGPDQSALSLTYLTQVAQAIGAGQRTATFSAYQSDVKQYGSQPPLSVSAASGLGPLAPESIASAFGTNLATTGTTVTVRDSAGTARSATVFFASAGQVNYEVPAGTAPGPATITILNNGNPAATGGAFIDTVAPGIFTANASGQGVPAALIFLNGNYIPVFQCGAAAGSCVPAAVDVSSGQAYLVLFATGIRGRSSLSNTGVSIGSMQLTPAYAGPQNTYPGLDQVNVLLPASLAGSGTVTATLSVDGRVSNAVTLLIR